jgi:hypothetical protein
MNCNQCKKHYPHETSEYLCPDCYYTPRLLPKTEPNYVDTPDRLQKKIDLLLEYDSIFSDSDITDRLRSLLNRDKWTSDQLTEIANVFYDIAIHMQEKDVGEDMFDRFNVYLKPVRTVLQIAPNSGFVRRRGFSPYSNTC